MEALRKLKIAEEQTSNMRDEVRLIRKERDEMKSMQGLNIGANITTTTAASCMTCVQFLKEKADLLQQRDNAEKRLIDEKMKYGDLMLQMTEKDEELDEMKKV